MGRLSSIETFPVFFFFSRSRTKVVYISNFGRQRFRARYRADVFFFIYLSIFIFLHPKPCGSRILSFPSSKKKKELFLPRTCICADKTSPSHLSAVKISVGATSPGLIASGSLDRVYMQLKVDLLQPDS